MNKDKLQQLATEMEACLEKVRSALEELETNKKWKPKNGENYYYVEDYGYMDVSTWNCCCGDDLFRLSQGNVFHTADKAEAHLENLKAKAELRELAEELNEGYSILWEKDCIQPKWYIYYDWRAETLKTANDLNMQTQGVIYCLSHNFLDIAISRIGADRLKAMIESGV